MQGPNAKAGARGEWREAPAILEKYLAGAPELYILNHDGGGRPLDATPRRGRRRRGFVYCQ
jgi:hypothetical protein